MDILPVDCDLAALAGTTGFSVSQLLKPQRKIVNLLKVFTKTLFIF
jgi:hypothetical protein